MKKTLFAFTFLCAFASALFSQAAGGINAFSIRNLRSYPFKTSPIVINELAFKNALQYAYNISYTSMGLSVSGRLSVPANTAGIKGIVLMMRGYQSTAGYRTAKGTENPARGYLRAGWAVIAPDFLGYAASSPAPAPAELHQFYSTVNAVELYRSLQAPGFRYRPAVAAADRAALPAAFKKIVFWGHSNGGQVAIQTLEVLGEPVPTVLWAPVCIDFPASMVNYQPERRNWADAFTRSYPAADFALLECLDGIAPGTPILLEQGTRDTAVPKSWSDGFDRAVASENARRERAGRGKIALRYEVYQNADHNLSPYWDTILPGDAAFWSQW